MSSKRTLRIDALAICAEKPLVAVGYNSGLIVIHDFVSPNENKVKLKTFQLHDKFSAVSIIRIKFCGPNILGLSYSNGHVVIIDIETRCREISNHSFDSAICDIEWIVDAQLMVLSVTGEAWLITPSKRGYKVQPIGFQNTGYSISYCSEYKLLAVVRNDGCHMFSCVRQRLIPKFYLKNCIAATLDKRSSRFVVLFGSGEVSLVDHSEKVRQLGKFKISKLIPRLLTIEALRALIIDDGYGQSTLISFENVSPPNRLISLLRRSRCWASNAAGIAVAGFNSKSGLQELTLYRNDGSVAGISELRVTDRKSDQKITVLHISDLHFQKSEEASTAARRIVERVKIDDKSISYIVFSGDISDHCGSMGYKAGVVFFKELARSLAIPKVELTQRVIIVPGNHDVDYAKSSQAFVYCGSFAPGYHKSPGDIDLQHGGLRESKVDYEKRFERFSKEFYFKLMGENYPLKPGDQWKTYNSGRDSLILVALNSATTIDHINEHRAALNAPALNKALSRVTRLRKRIPDAITLAVVHHPCGDEPRCIPTSEAQLLSVDGLVCILHGDSHRPAAKPSEAATGSVRAQIGAGYAGTMSKQLPEGEQWMFHYVDVDWTKQEVVITSRRREGRLGPWLPATRYGRDSRLDFCVVTNWGN